MAGAATGGGYGRQGFEADLPPATRRSILDVKRRLADLVGTVVTNTADIAALPRGVVAVGSSAVDQSVSGGSQFVNPGVSFNFVSGRRYRLGLHLDLAGTAGEVWVVEHRTYKSGAPTVRGRYVIVFASTGSSFTVDSSVLTVAAGTNGDTSYDPVIYRSVGSNNATVRGASGRTVQMYIEDVGAS